MSSSLSNLLILLYLETIFDHRYTNKGLVPEVLNTLPHLNSIILGGNKIDRWNASTFENMMSLRKLNIAGNTRYLFSLNINICKDELLNALLVMFLRCDSLHNDNVFNLIKVEKTLLSNVLMKLYFNIFRPLSGLKRLSCRENAIAYMNVSTFHTLQHLDLSENNIYILHLTF
jgi:hypothetical protein